MPRKASAAPRKRNKPGNTLPAVKATKPGRPAWVPTEKDRSIVMLGCLAGLTQEQIADHLGVCVETMKAHLDREWRIGKDKIVLQATASMVSMASDPKHPKAFQASSFILRTKGGFVDHKPPREIEDDEHGNLEAGQTGVTKDGIPTFSIIIGKAEAREG